MFHPTEAAKSGRYALNEFLKNIFENEFESD